MECVYIGVVANETVFTRTYAGSCSEWTYDRRVFGKTFVEELNLVCRHSELRPLLSSALQFGAMFMFFTGRMTDRIGRRRSMHLLIALLLITSITTQSLLQYVPMSLNQK